MIVQLLVLWVMNVDGQLLLTSWKSPVVAAVRPSNPGLLAPQLKVQVTVSVNGAAVPTPPGFCAANL